MLRKRTIRELASCIAQSDMGRSLPFIAFPLLGSVVLIRREVRQSSIVSRGGVIYVFATFSTYSAQARKGVETTSTATKGAAGKFGVVAALKHAVPL